MSAPRVVILAAGRGGRLAPLTDRVPKSLLPIGGVPALLRAVDAFLARGPSDVVVVVGHREQEIRDALAGRAVRFVRNARYAEDVNVLSLALGFEGDDRPTFVLEGDVVFDEDCADAFARAIGSARSIWFTYGRFRSPQLGGILAHGAGREVTDLRYVPAFSSQWASYDKLLGALWVGPGEAATFRRKLEAAAAESTRQYYMMSWVRHLSELPCLAQDVGGFRAGTFNTFDEYRACERRLAGDPA